MKKLFATVFATVALSVGAVPAMAAPVVVIPGGLVNVFFEDVNVTVTVPIAIAAALCDINVNVLAVQLRNGNATCTATATSG